MYFGKQKRNTNDRIPPNQNVTTSFPVLHHGNVPNYRELSSWNLKLFGEIKEKEIIFSFKDLMNLPQIDVQNDIHCVTGWSKLDNIWTGISVRELIKKVNLNKEVKFVILHAEEGWTTNLPIEDFLKETSVLAHSHNKKPLTPEHGYPIRAVVPHLYFWKSAKWLRGIEFTSQNEPGFWERNGYHMYGDPWKEERFSWD
ncbi:sulfite oxidase-like oxidoreductase [Bacillus timonensis]|nr:sulfite oxidase-like oxidoreductase [Bacillus timonensis]